MPSESSLTLTSWYVNEMTFNPKLAMVTMSSLQSDRGSADVKNVTLLQTFYEKIVFSVTLVVVRQHCVTSWQS